MSPARAAPPWLQTHRRHQVLYDKSSSQVYGLWPLARCPAPDLPQDDGKRGPKSQPQTTNYRTLISLTSTHSEPPHKEGPKGQGLLPPTPLGVASSFSLRIEEVRLQEMSFLLFHVKGPVNSGSCRSLLASNSYESISSDPNSPSRSHHSSKLESLVLGALQAFSHLSVLGQQRWQPDAPGPILSFRLCQSPDNQRGTCLGALRWDKLWRESSCKGPEAEQGGASRPEVAGRAAKEGSSCSPVGPEGTPRLSLLKEIPILRSFYLSGNKLTSNLTCTSPSYIFRK